MLYVSTDEGRISRPRAHKYPLPRVEPHCPKQSLRRKQSRWRPLGSGGPPHLRNGCGHHSVLQQLWAVPVPGESHPSLCHQSPSKSNSPSLWGWAQCPRLDSRHRSLRSNLGSTPTRQVRRGVQRRGNNERSNIELTMALTRWAETT